MSMHDINRYLKRCGQHVPPQRIEQIFQRHSVEDSDGKRVLNLKGFLAYYRDAVHNSESQVSPDFISLFSLEGMLSNDLG